VLVDETLQGKNVFEHQFTHVPFCVQNTGQRYERIKMETAVDGFAWKQWQMSFMTKLTYFSEIPTPHSHFEAAGR
jgi:hypothetical protein